MTSLPKFHSFGKRSSVQPKKAPKEKPRVVIRTLSSSSFSMVSPATKMRKRLSTFLNGSSSTSNNSSPEQGSFRHSLFSIRQNGPGDCSDNTSTTSSESDHTPSSPLSQKQQLLLQQQQDNNNNHEHHHQPSSVPVSEFGVVSIDSHLEHHANDPAITKQPQDVWCTHQDIWVVSPPNPIKNQNQNQLQYQYYNHHHQQQQQKRQQPQLQPVTPHTNPKPELVRLQLAQQVSRVLGSVMADVDEEIDQEWEISRAALTLSLSHCV
ncbi:hypothetical protein J3Q64DRAFT_1766034 [Phycomyces blakesleeanus]|uniref:Uncharacterized protein n=1 Tax=Phycomyces blakesleeanus TaxID=4837 RepID=A0ABR3AP61_PHYBL